ncbi:MAG: GNAT family N-acetyltransferase [Promethearchaeota archaeon]
MFEVIRIGRNLMPTFCEILNSNYDMIKDYLQTPHAHSEYHVNESWIERNFDKREFYLARIDGKWEGAASFQQIQDFAYIGYFFIRNGYHQKGYGRQFMQYLEFRAKLQNLNAIRLFVHKKANWAQQAYQKWGFSLQSTSPEEIKSLYQGILTPFYEPNHYLFQKHLN